MLVASQVIPEGPSDGSIKEGDILLTVDDSNVIKFARLEDILDSKLGSTVLLLLLRGGEEITMQLKVLDLHSVTPDRFFICAPSTRRITRETLGHRQGH